MAPVREPCLSPATAKCLVNIHSGKKLMFFYVQEIQPARLRQVFTCSLERGIVQPSDRFDTAFFAALKSVLCFVHRETSDVSLEFESCHGILCLKFSLLFFWHSRIGHCCSMANIKLIRGHIKIH